MFKLWFISNKMGRLVLPILLCLTLLAGKSHGQDLKAQTNVPSPKLIGGMYYHGGYISSLENFTYGIGGKMSYKINNHLRIGGEGYNSNSVYDKDGSFFQIGWGGALVEAVLPKGRFRYFLGITIGGGSTKHLSIQNIDNINNIQAQWRRESLMLTYPFIGFEYSVIRKVNFTAKIDYLFSPTHSLEQRGARLYLGFLFNMK